MNVVITGGCGFIGSALVRYLMKKTVSNIVNIDKLTYAGDIGSLGCVSSDPRYKFLNNDILDAEILEDCFYSFKPDMVIHLAAESHVDRSIREPSAFIQTNVVGTQVLLDVALRYWEALPEAKRNAFRFHHVSTDEVFGSLGLLDPAFTETSLFKPNSPYAASKAASDHLVRAWHKTYGLPVVISNCSNNYGPWQSPEKLIPLMCFRAVVGGSLPVYGLGKNVRDWLHVDDHVDAIWQIATRGIVGESYNVGGDCEIRNIDLVHKICEFIHGHQREGVTPPLERVEYVPDRLGHDERYGINCGKLKRSLGWKPKIDFHDGIKQTVFWYVDNLDWCQQKIDTAILS